MLWVILSMPLYALLCIASIWIWWGIAFTIIDFTLHLAAQEESPMTTHAEMFPVIYPAKLIRFATLSDKRADLLSTFDAERNLLTIDPDNYQLLERNWQTHVEFSELPATLVTSEGNFVAASVGWDK